MASKRKHLNVVEKIKLLDFYEIGNVSTLDLVNKFEMRRTQATDLIKI